MSGGDRVPFLERAANAHRHRLLADRDVQEPRQLARAEPLLDLLLEAPDQEHLAQVVGGELKLLASGETVASPPTERPTLEGSWDAALAVLPPDWSDLYCEVELTSTDHLEQAALLLAPTNPARYGGKPALRFRCS